MKKKIVLAYSGGLDTTVSIKWLQEKYDAEIVTVTVDIGQDENFAQIGGRARALEVANHYTVDAKEEFVREYIFPSIRANGLYQGKYPLGTALARPLIASKIVEIAEKESAFAVAHGCTGKGNDQVRFDVTIKALNRNLAVIAPIREWNMSRDAEINYAVDHKIPIKPKKSVYSVDQNLWGRSIEGGPLEDPGSEPMADVFEWIRPVEGTPSKPASVEIEFSSGLPISLNGRDRDPVTLIAELNKLGGTHGFGIVDHIEDRLVGIKSREVYECPAALCIIEAHRDLEKLVLTRHQLSIKTLLEQEWAWLVYSGLWVEPLREDLQAFIDSTQRKVNGSVRIRLHHGSLRVVGRSSPNSLYSHHLATYDASSTFDQKAAVGFIELWGLPSRVAKSRGEAKKMEVRITEPSKGKKTS